MGVFSIPYLDWIDSPEHGFNISEVWDDEKAMFVGAGKLKLFPYQRRILSHIMTQRSDGSFPYSTILWSQIKKSGKTAISASVGAWFLECGNAGMEAYAVSNSEGQSARLVLGDIDYHFRKVGGAIITQKSISLPEKKTKLFPVTKSYTSFAGGRISLTLFDELFGFVSESDRRRYDELQPVPTVPHSMRFISTYAGFYGESNLLYELYMQGVGTEEDPNGKGKKIPELDDLPCWSNGSMFTFWDHEPRMPWQNEKYYFDARANNRPSAYIRLHENNWVTSNEEFIPIEAWDIATKKFEQSAEIWNDHPYRYSPVYIGVDTGLRHDCTGVVGVCPDEKLGKVIQIFHKKWTPIEGDTLNLQLVEDYIVDKCKKFNVQEIACDPSQMLQEMNRLRSMGYNVYEFTQSGGAMVKASQNLYDLLHNKNLWAYPSEDMREHLQNVVAQVTSSGYRIVKDKSNRRLAMKKIDLAVALAMAAERAVETMGICRVDPIVVEACLSKYSDNRPSNYPKYIPFELRE